MSARRRLVAGILWALAATACAPVAFAGPECGPTTTGIPLPPEIDETSGIAISQRDPGVLWTHNDDGAVLYAIDSSGRLLASYRIRPRLRDWEDIAVGECGDPGWCLYLADLGDNDETRAAGSIRIVRLQEPQVDHDRLNEVSDRRLEGDVFPIRLPDGPRDVEALLVLPGERVYVVTKGRNHPITVYRYPDRLRPDTVTLVDVQRLTDDATSLADQVTGASVEPGGSIVAIRTYQAIEFFRMEADTLARSDGGLVNLRSLREIQGEAVGLGADGLVVTTSEGGPFGGSPVMNLLRCEWTGL